MKKYILIAIFAFIISIAIGISSAFLVADKLFNNNQEQSLILKENMTKTIDELSAINEWNNQQIADFVLVQHIMVDGATLIQANSVIEASNRYQLDPKLVSALIKSESDYKRDKHSLKEVIGICGINSKVWDNLSANIHTDSGNIEACCFILNYYMQKNNFDVLKSLTKFKGNNKAGYVEALKTYKYYENNK